MFTSCISHTCVIHFPENLLLGQMSRDVWPAPRINNVINLFWLQYLLIFKCSGLLTDQHHRPIVPPIWWIPQPSTHRLSSGWVKGWGFSRWYWSSNRNINTTWTTISTLIYSVLMKQLNKENPTHVYHTYRYLSLYHG